MAAREPLIKVSARLTLALLLAAALPAAALAEDGGLRDLCPARPGKDTPPCIVDQGHLLLEVGLADAARTRAAGSRQDAVVLFSPNFRYGLTDRLEAGLNLVPFERIRTLGPDGARSAVSGAGDTQLTLKYSLRNPAGDGVSVAAQPFVNLPTAQHGLGAHGFEGGLVVPISMDLPEGWSLSLDPEIDALRSQDGGLHPAYVGVISLSRDIVKGLNGSVELWSSLDEAPGAHVRQSTFDLSLAWIPPSRPNLQLDGGVNLGVAGQAPDVEAYVGVSRRF